MKKFSFIIPALLIGLALVLTSCETKNTSDQNRIDQTTGNAGDNLRQGAEDIGNATSNAADDVANWTEETFDKGIDNLKIYTFNQKDNYQDHVDKILDRFENSLDAWKDHRGNVTMGNPGTTTNDNARTKVSDKTYKDLQERVNFVRNKVKGLDNATSGNWSKLRGDINQSLTDLRQSFKKQGITIASEPSTGMNNRPGTDLGTGTGTANRTGKP